MDAKQWNEAMTRARQGIKVEFTVGPDDLTPEAKELLREYVDVHDQRSGIPCTGEIVTGKGEDAERIPFEGVLYRED